MTDPIRVLIADDHPLFRDGLTAMLQTGDDTELTGAATDGLQAVELALHSKPDVVVMDVPMRRRNGVEATRRIMARAPTTVVFLCSTYQLGDLPADAKTSGARAYVNKEEFGPNVLSELWAARGDGTGELLTTG